MKIRVSRQFEINGKTLSASAEVEFEKEEVQPGFVPNAPLTGDDIKAVASCLMSSIRPPEQQ